MLGATATREDGANDGPRRFLIIIGAAKCGTTSLFKYLGSHPRIDPCTTKEPNYFASEDNFSAGFEEYQSLWNWGSDDLQWAVEASVHYTKRPRYSGAAQRMAQTAQRQDAEFRLVYLVRDPIERIESHITTGWNSRWYGPLPDGPMADYDEQIDGQSLWGSAYAEQLQPFAERFPDSLLVLNTTDLRQNPESVLNEICNFCDVGIQYEFSELGKNHNRTAGIYRPGKIWQWALRLRMGWLTDVLPSWLRRPLRELLGEPLDDKYRLTANEEDFVRALLRSEMQKLAREYGVDIEKWPRWSGGGDERRTRKPGAIETWEDSLRAGKSDA